MTSSLAQRIVAGATMWTLLAISFVVSAQDEPRRVCDYDTLTIRSDFSGGRISGCEQLSANHYRLTIKPEDEPPINTSPWYAFIVTSEVEQSVTVDLVYTYFKHRYWPKYSRDSRQWSRFDSENVTILDDGSARLTLTVNEEPLFVAGQEILPYEFHTAWAKKMAARHDLNFVELGLSRHQKPIYKIETKGSDQTEDYIFIVGRQHPPEVTGALALVPYTETLFAETALAKRFRDTFGIVIVPALNPDGVEQGHWRHSMGSKDLNRDWGPFTQPETRLMREELERFRTDERLWLFLDFHSTARNVLYTQADDEATNPAHFAANWTKVVKARVKNYAFERAPRPVTALPTSKNYVYTTFGVPAITYEVGDETNRKSIEDAAVVFAEEMMRLLLDAKANQ